MARLLLRRVLRPGLNTAQPRTAADGAGVLHTGKLGPLWILAATADVVPDLVDDAAAWMPEAHAVLGR